MVGDDGVRDVLQHHRLTALRRSYQQSALAFADRCNDVDDASGDVFLATHVALKTQMLVGVQRREVLEQDLVLAVFRRLTVDLVELDHCEIALAIFRRADFTFNGVTCVQVETADLRRRNVDVVGACKVGNVGRAQETEAVRQNFERAITIDRLALLRAVFQQRKDEFLFFQAVGAFNAVGGGHFQQLTDVEGFELREVHGSGRVNAEVIVAKKERKDV